MARTEQNGFHRRNSKRSAGDRSARPEREHRSPETAIRTLNMQGAQLAGADLQGEHFAGVDLCGANLKGANLSGACLAGAIMA
ncbi:MAG: pentapeptide repeat-containing protein, partial [Cyanobacteria bacterium J06555_12]